MSLGTSAIHARSQTNNKNIDICENTLLLKRVYCGMFNIFLPADDEVAIIIKNVSGTGHLCVSLRFRFVYLVGTVSHVRRKNIDVVTLLLLSASPVKGCHSGVPISIWSHLLHHHPHFNHSLAASINLLLGLPHFLFPGNSILSIRLPIYRHTHHLFLRIYPYHLSLASRVFSPNFPTCAVPLMYSFLILSIIVTPNENLQLATSISA